MNEKMNVREFKPGTVLEPGLWRMPENLYHADPCPAPSLSSSTLKCLLEFSPLHAWHGHPKLGAGEEQKWSSAMDFGSAVHKLALGYGADIVVIDAGDYRGKDAKAARDAAIAGGKIPCLAEPYKGAHVLATFMQDALENYLGCKITEALREVVVIWKDNGHWRRAMIDAMHPNLRILADLKSTQASAAPEDSIKRIYDMGYHISQAHYVAGLDALDPEGMGRRSFGFIFGEASAPYAVSPPLEITEAGRTLAESQRHVGSELWDSCLSRNIWPGYGMRPQLADPKPWTLSAWEFRMQNDNSLNPVQAVEEHDHDDESRV